MCGLLEPPPAAVTSVLCVAFSSPLATGSSCWPLRDRSLMIDSICSCCLHSIRLVIAYNTRSLRSSANQQHIIATYSALSCVEVDHRYDESGLRQQRADVDYAQHEVVLHEKRVRLRNRPLEHVVKLSEWILRCKYG